MMMELRLRGMIMRKRTVSARLKKYIFNSYAQGIGEVTRFKSLNADIVRKGAEINNRRRDESIILDTIRKSISSRPNIVLDPEFRKLLEDGDKVAILNDDKTINKQMLNGVAKRKLRLNENALEESLRDYDKLYALKEIMGYPDEKRPTIDSLMYHLKEEYRVNEAIIKSITKNKPNLDITDVRAYILSEGKFPNNDIYVSFREPKEGEYTIEKKRVGNGQKEEVKVFTDKFRAKANAYYVDLALRALEELGEEPIEQQMDFARIFR
ncbi:hypothetical protein OAE88_00510 [bacterium]|nr:hypothetical protein [bacterium]